jgi:hypothetical protein
MIYIYIYYAQKPENVNVCVENFHHMTQKPQTPDFQTHVIFPTSRF